MGVRLSHSSKNTYLVCGHKYALHYLHRYRSVMLSSALVYGGAIDNALNTMLEDKDAPDILERSIKTFMEHWEQGEGVDRKSKVDIPLNPNIRYFKSEWDGDLFEKEDWREILKYDSKFFETKNEVDEKLKNGVDWIDIPEEQRSVINYAYWLGLTRKGKMLLTAYYTDILPKIKRVISVQRQVELLDEAGNVLNGVIDFVAELHDGSVAIIDNKTSSKAYEQDSVSGSEQLAQYYKILNLFAEDPENEWNTKIDKCAYAVMVKALEKDITKTCKSCNHVGQGSHKTCDNLISGKRCGGDWEKIKKFKVITQFIEGYISESFADEVLENAVTVKSCIEAGLFPKNYSNCDNQFGSKCVYYNKCHKNDERGLVKLEDKK